MRSPLGRTDYNPLFMGLLKFFCYLFTSIYFLCNPEVKPHGRSYDSSPKTETIGHRGGDTLYLSPKTDLYYLNILKSQEIMEFIQPTYSLSQDAPHQLVHSLSKRLGSGIIWFENFSSGLHLLYINMKPIKPITLMTETIDWNYGISFNLTGHSEVYSSEHRRSISAKAGSNVHYAFPGLANVKEEVGITHKFKICILFDKKTLLDLANEDEEAFLPFLKGLKTQSPVYGQGKTVPEMKRALSQLAACPYTGKSRTLFLEGKMLEIFAHKLEELRAKGKSSPRPPRINAIDTERMHYAAELLVHDPVNPPNATDLAQKIGVSRSKFYQNFKMVFGHSPLDHLRRHRLQIARQLLRQGSHNVTESAFAVGFSNQSHFTKIFVAEFGVLPHQLI